MKKRILKEITVEIIQKCPNKCLFCSSNSSLMCETFIPLEKLEEISLFAKSKGAKEICISGGEPLLHKNILSYLHFNDSMGLRNIIYTSGNIPEKTFNEILENIYERTEGTKFIFDFPAVSSHKFRKLTSVSREDIIINMMSCLEKEIDIEVHIVPNKINLSNIYLTCSWLKVLGVKQVNLLKLVLQGRALENKDLLFIEDYTKLKEIVDEIENDLCDKNFKLRCGIPFNDIVGKNKKCFAIKNKLVIKYDGNILPCEAFKDDKDLFILGNIYRNNLEDVWIKTDSFKNEGECLYKSKCKEYLHKLVQLSRETDLYGC